MAFYNTNTHRSETGPLRQVIKRKVEEIDQICERVLKEQDDFCGSIYQNNDLLRIAKRVKQKQINLLENEMTHPSYVSLFRRAKQKARETGESTPTDYYSSNPFSISDLSEKDLKILKLTGQIGGRKRVKRRRILDQNSTERPTSQSSPIACAESNDLKGSRFSLKARTRKGLISSFERLPQEILEPILLHSHNFELPLASKTVFNKLTSTLHSPSFSKTPSDAHNILKSKPFGGQGLHLQMLFHISIPVQHYRTIKPEDINTFEYFFNNNMVHISPLVSGEMIPKSNKLSSLTTDQLKHVYKLPQTRAVNVNVLRRKFVTAEMLQRAGIKYFIEFWDSSSTFAFQSEPRITSLSQILSDSLSQVSPSKSRSRSQSRSQSQSVSVSRSSSRSQTPSQPQPSTIFSKYLLHPSQKTKKTKSGSLSIKQNLNGNGQCVEVSRLSTSLAQKLPYFVLPIPSFLFALPSESEFTSQNFSYDGTHDFSSLIPKRNLDIIIYLLNFKSYSAPFIKASTSLKDNEIMKLLNIDEYEQKMKNRVVRTEMANDLSLRSQTDHSGLPANAPAENGDNDDAPETTVQSEIEVLEELELVKLKECHESVCSLLLMSAIQRRDFQALQKLSDKKVTIVTKEKRKRLRAEESDSESAESTPSDLQNSSLYPSGHFLVDLNPSENEETNNLDEDEEIVNDENEEDNEPKTTTYHLICASSAVLCLTLKHIPGYDTDDLHYTRLVIDMCSEEVLSSDTVWEWLLSGPDVSAAVLKAEKETDCKFGNKSNKTSIQNRFSKLRDLAFMAGGRPSLNAISAQTK